MGAYESNGIGVGIRPVRDRGNYMLLVLQEEALSRPLRRYTPRSITDPKVLARELDSIRRTGIAIEREEAAMGGCCVASPVLLAGEPIAALSVSVPKDRFAPELLAPAVRTAALALGRVLARSSTGQSEG